MSEFIFIVCVENLLALSYAQSHIWNEGKGRLMQALSPPASPRRDGSPTSSNSIDHDESVRWVMLLW